MGKEVDVNSRCERWILGGGVGERRVKTKLLCPVDRSECRHFVHVITVLRCYINVQ